MNNDPLALLLKSFRLGTMAAIYEALAGSRNAVAA